MKPSRIANRTAALILLVAATLASTAAAGPSAERATARVVAGTCCW